VERELRSTTKEPIGLEFETEVEALLSRYFTSALNADPDTDADAGNVHQIVIDQVERPLIKLALGATNGNKVRAAALLGLNRNTLRSKINSLGVGSGD
jgi:two-component system nitrogen regulation response regulator GlnG